MDPKGLLPAVQCAGATDSVSVLVSAAVCGHRTRLGKRTRSGKRTWLVDSTFGTRLAVKRTCVQILCCITAEGSNQNESLTCDTLDVIVTIKKAGEG